MPGALNVILYWWTENLWLNFSLWDSDESEKIVKTRITLKKIFSPHSDSTPHIIATNDSNKTHHRKKSPVGC